VPGGGETVRGREREREKGLSQVLVVVVYVYHITVCHAEYVCYAEHLYHMSFLVAAV
jgi:hypothetical protein